MAIVSGALIRRTIRRRSNAWFAIAGMMFGLSCGQARHSTDSSETGAGGSPATGGMRAVGGSGQPGKVAPEGPGGAPVVLLPGGAPGSGGFTEGTPSDCITTTVSVRARAPLEVELLVQASASMNEAFDEPSNPASDQQSRWSRARDALTHASAGLLMGLEQDLVALSIFSSTPESVDSDFCAWWVAQVDGAIGNYEAILESYPPSLPPEALAEEAPLADAIERRLTEIERSPTDAAGPTVLLVVTDGEVSGCGIGDSREAAQRAAIEAAERAYAQGVPTLVLYAGGPQTGFAQELANAGQGLAVDEEPKRYFDPVDVEDLKRALEPVLAGVFSCEVDFEGTVPPDRASQGRVQLDEETLVFADPNGWFLVESNRIELVGDACARLGDGEAHTVTIAFPCNVDGE